MADSYWGGLEKQIHRSMKQNREPAIKSHLYG